MRNHPAIPLPTFNPVADARWMIQGTLNLIEAHATARLEGGEFLPEERRFNNPLTDIGFWMVEGEATPEACDMWTFVDDATAASGAFTFTDESLPLWHAAHAALDRLVSAAKRGCLPLSR